MEVHKITGDESLNSATEKARKWAKDNGVTVSYDGWREGAYIFNVLRDIVRGKNEDDTVQAKIDFFLTWKNDYLTIQKMGADYGISDEEAEARINEGRELHEAATRPNPLA